MRPSSASYKHVFSSKTKFLGYLVMSCFLLNKSLSFAGKLPKNQLPFGESTVKLFVKVYLWTGHSQLIVPGVTQQLAP